MRSCAQALKLWYHKNECVEQHRVLQLLQLKKVKKLKTVFPFTIKEYTMHEKGWSLKCHWCRLHLVQFWKDMI